MKLYSHGPESDLREHLAEVMSAAETPEERIVCACHDLGKATIVWQEYILGREMHSPHHHAAAGGVFAALLLLELGGGEAEMWALAALHAGAAHHTALQELGSDALGDLSVVACDPQVRAFVFDPSYGIASLLPDVPAEKLVAAWERFVGFAPPSSREKWSLNRTLNAALSPPQRLTAYLRGRSLLGRLCVQDHLSAARQSGKTAVIREWRSVFPEAAFAARPARDYGNGESPLGVLRSRLREAFLKTMDEGRVFSFIDAPTGLGKTEAMLRGAELLAEREGFRRIVFAVPQVSVADQVYEDYFATCSAQIWNYRRRERTVGEGKSAAELRSGNGTDAEAFEVEQHPFQMSYNATTFNQVLLAMCHSNRNRCIRGLGLRDAVVILDEFHKLPQVILPFFFRIAREYAEQCRCKFILGSATPLERFRFWDLEDSARIDPALTGPLYRAPEIDNRRLYSCAGRLTVAALGAEIAAFQDESDENLLVVVNLVGDGSWPLRKHFGQRYQPWEQLEALKSPGSDRIMVWLDGLVPPGLRRELIIACRDAMATRRPVTLISTQMIEVGVDLDFDAGLIDYQGLAATIQRGGRVGRNGRDKPCKVRVFSLTDEEEKSSFRKLQEVQEKYGIRSTVSLFEAVFKKEKSFHREEEQFFEKWGDRVLHDSDLADSLSEIQRRIFSELSFDASYGRLFRIQQISSQSVGASFEQAQFIAELFDSENTEDIILLESQELVERLCELSTRIRRQASTPEDRRELLKLLSDRTISPSRKVRPELGLIPCCRIDYPEPLEVFRVDSLIL